MALPTPDAAPAVYEMPPKGKRKTETPKVSVEVEYAGEDWVVDIICPSWASHKAKGGEPPNAFEEEGGESMWELYVKDHGEKAAEKAFKARAAAEAAEEKAANDARIASLKKSFAVFDTDGSGSLDAEEVVEILTRMTPGGTALTKADAEEFIKEFDRDGDGCLDVNEFICAMGVVSDAYDGDGDGEADLKDGEGKFDGKEDEFAKKLADGDTLLVANLKSGNVSEAVEEARRLQG